MKMRLVLAALLSVGLVACGGGSGGGGVTVPPSTPTGVSVSAGEDYVLIDVLPVSGATSYNIYWSTASDVSKTNGTLIQVAATPKAQTGLSSASTYYYVVTAVNSAGESAASARVSATPTGASGTVDPLFSEQWHLSNTGQQGKTGVSAITGEDLQVSAAWAAGYKGAGVRIAIVDEGLEIAHEDMASNVSAGQSYNYLTGSTDPTNESTDTTSGNGHGTSCAGIAAARDLNGLGGRGVAPRASLVGYNLLQSQTSSNEADAMIRNAANVSVSSNSWGATDGIGELSSRPTAWKSAIDTGLSIGRGGKGTVYLWAAGNGAQSGNNYCAAYLGWDCIDNSNYDGQANYRGVMAVAAVNDQGKKSSYSEQGANLWVAAPGGEYCGTHTITTTDRTGDAGENTAATAGVSDLSSQNYTKCMNGTSSATPGAAGVVALMLSANPDLGWRDVRIIMALAARVNDSTDSDWTGSSTTPPYHFNHKYGFGVADAEVAVNEALAWTNVGTEVSYTSPVYTVGTLIPDNDMTTGVNDTRTISGSGISYIEWVEVTFTATNSPYSGDLDVTLTSPNGAVSHLAAPHFCEGSHGGCTNSYSGWVFGSARHLGEAANGAWQLTVKDGVSGGTGSFSSWRLKFYGH